VQAPTAGASASVAGNYQFRPPVHDETADYFLVLNQDGTAEIDERLVGSDETTVDAAGSWTQDGDAVVLAVDTVRGEPVSGGETIRFQFEDGFPTVSDIKIGDELVHLENTTFSLGAGEQHPLVHELNRRLAAVEWLGFTDPGTDVYGEDTRQAVVAFQKSQGLTPHGALDAETWLLLDNPKPPLPTPTPLATSGEAITSVPDLDDLPTETESGQPILYLTFDDGPSSQNTTDLLDLLDQYDAQVTFFNVGSSVKKHPELVRDVASRGHYLADHTWDHKTLEGMSHEKFVNEVERTRQAILDAAGDLMTLDHNVRYVRPPYGATDDNTRQYAADLGMAIVLWNVDTQDWRRPGAKAISNHLLSHAKPGTIILMHDGGGDRSQTIEGLRTALPQLQEQGYVFHNIFLP
jgi:peptidoglycan/xylan/chitin deacetylase (PgdA/CDA1 family)